MKKKSYKKTQFHLINRRKVTGINGLIKDVCINRKHTERQCLNLKCMFLTFNILLESKNIISFCTDLNSQIIYSSAKLITGLFTGFM